MPSTCCCVPGCSNRGGHRFPKDAYVRQQWIKAVRREEEGGIKWKPSTSTVVCKKHFQSDDYFRSDVTYFGTERVHSWLKPSAVPSVFPWSPAHTQSDSEHCLQSRQPYEENAEIMSEEQESDWDSQTDSYVVGGYHVYQSQTNEEQSSSPNGSGESGLAEIQVKSEPPDAGYEQSEDPGIPQIAAVHGSVGGNPVLVATASQNELWSGSAIKEFIGNKTVGAGTSIQNVQNVIEELLKKNETLLSQNDALGFKPNSRRGRLPADGSKRVDAIFPQAGQSYTFPAGPGAQGRVSSARSRSSPQPDQSSSVLLGKLMRPKSPTRRCSIPEKDKSHFGLALMESKVGDEEGEIIFKVQQHEMVCALASRTKFMNMQGQTVAMFDVTFYWCNFCTFSTMSKAQLVQHVVEHRFHCKYCRYQSFSRADVIHHSTHTHPDYQEVAAATQYCTLLSDYLRIHNPKTSHLDRRKRKFCNDIEKDESDGRECDPLDKLSKLVKSVQNDGKINKKVKSKHTEEYDLFDMEIEEVEETPSENAEQEMPNTEGHSKNSIPSPKTSAAALDSVVSSPIGHYSLQSSQPVTMYKQSAAKLSQTLPLISQILSAPPTSHTSRSPGPSPQDQTLQNNHHRASVNSSNRSNSAGTPSPSPATPTPSTGGGTPHVRSGLYWSCGYCSFTSKSQSEIKDHSVCKHNGKPHRYVALIKPDESSLSSASKPNAENSSSSNIAGNFKNKNCNNNVGDGRTGEANRLGAAFTEHNVEIDVAEENQFTTSSSSRKQDQIVVASNPQTEAVQENLPDGNINQLSENTITSDNEDIPTTVKDEPVDSDEEIVPIKVRFPKTRIKSKDNSSLKCYHCSYSARMLGPLRNHILYRHKGRCLVGQGPMKSKVFMCARTDCTFRSSSGQTYLTHAHDCTPWTNPEVRDIKVEAHLLACLEETIHMAIEVQKSSSQTAQPSASPSIQGPSIHSKVQQGGDQVEG